MSESSGSDWPPARQAATLQRRLGVLRHEALMLAMKGRHVEAGRLLLEELRVNPADVAKLHPEQRRLLNIAATYLEKGGDVAAASSLFEALGEDERAAQSRTAPASTSMPVSQSSPVASPAPLSPDREEFRPSEPDLEPKSGVEPTAAAEARKLAAGLMKQGKHVEAAEYLGRAGLHFDAGACFVKAADVTRALAEFRQVPQGSSQYPAAARTMIRVLLRLGRCSPQLAPHISPFVQRGPADDEEAALLLRWSELLERQGFDDYARTALEAVLRNCPENEDARARLARRGRVAMSPTVWAMSAQASPPPYGTGDVQPLSSPVATQRSAYLTSTREPGTAIEQGIGTDPPSVVRVSEMPPGVAAPAVLGPGVIVGDRFRLEAEIGQGGMATVFSATDLELDEEVAVKVFSGQLVTREWLADAVARFREELRVCRKLRHPNIIQVYDIGIHGGHRYFTMELLRGRSLASLLGQPLDVEWSLACLIQACTGLHAAHERGVVHRDVKPENIFITDDGIVKIMDFGIAKSAHNRGQTVVGTLAGTPEYIAPEQITGFSTVGPAADQYALGVVAYYMLTGELPFSHEEMMPLLTMHREQPAQPLRHIVPTLPERLEAIVLRMLGKNPTQRFGSCEIVAQELTDVHAALARRRAEGA